MIRTRHLRSLLGAACVLIALARPAVADGDVPIEAVLDPLVAEALARNVELAGGAATVAQRLAELDAARARYKPALDISARYSRADGGRTFDVPVGDLLNPVYATLEDLTGSPFPRLENQSFPLLRPEEQETKVTLTQPLYDPRLAPAVDARRDAHRGARASLAALRARVTRDVRQAYYDWLAARAAIEIADSALALARENERVNASLFTHGKVTRDLLLRAQADALALEQQQRAAEARATLARAYLNLLRNAPLDAPIEAAALDAEAPARLRRALEQRHGAPLALEPLTAAALARRPELAQLDAALAASEAQERLAGAALKPSVGLAVDAGTQGEDYGFDEADRFVLASVVVRFKAFDGGADRAGVRAARAARDAVAAQRAQAELAIRLEVQTALERLAVAEASLDAAAQRAEAAEAAFTIKRRKRDLGQVSQVEFLDARNALTDARLNLSVTRADALARLADVEYAAGLAPANVPEDVR